MKFLAIILAFTTSSASAALDLSPGLWSVQMKMKRADGTEVSPMANLEASMAQMPPEQRKMMMERLGKAGVGVGSGGATQACYTKEMFSNPKAFAGKEQQNCESKITTNTAKKVAMNFSCKNGSSGDAVWSATGSKAYEGIMHVTTAKDERSEINYKGKFVSADCGAVKPILSLNQ